MDVDCQLVRDVQRPVNGANVHQVKTWLFCFQLSKELFPAARSTNISFGALPTSQLRARSIA